MNVLPIPSARVSTLQRITLSSTTISAAQQALNTVAQQLSSGRAVTQASDNPAAAAVIQQLTQQLADGTQYATNIAAATTQLQNADASLTDLSAMLTQAGSTAAGVVSTTVDPAEREAAAATIDGIYNQAVSLANATYAGRYVFGTDDAAHAPYVPAENGLTYVGSPNTLSGQTDQAEQLSYQVPGDKVFGGLSASVSAGTNLSPALKGTDRLADLAGARNNGVTLGAITVANGGASATVDLTGADTVQDVVDKVNAAAVPGVTASVGTNGLNLTGASLTVTDAVGGTAAADLGIARSAAGGPITGASVATKVTPLTLLADLRNGAGLDASGFTLSNGTTTKTITTAGLSTVQDLVNAVNTAGLGVRANVRPDGTGIDLANATQGQHLTVSEAGGATAAQLGFTTFKPTTTLASLNKGRGVATPTGTQFTIATADGSSINVGLAGITATSTVQDAVDQINAAAAGKVTASLAANGGGGVVLTDNTAGAGTLAVTPVNSATTANDLGIAGKAAAGGKITGDDVNPVRVPGVLTDLDDLRKALRTNDTGGIARSAGRLSDDSKAVATVRGVVGGRVQELNSRASTLATQSTTTQSMLSGLQDVDYATTVTQYQLLQTSLQASLQVTSRTMNLSLMDYLS